MTFVQRSFGLLVLVTLSFGMACQRTDAPAAEAPPAEGAKGAAEAKAMSPGEALERKDAIPPPPDVAAAPADAEKTASGLASKVLTAAPAGAEKPRAQDRVTVHYTGWTTDGKDFDSSHKRGKPATFALSQVIPGWTEGLQLMAKGEKRRLWIPDVLAYKGRPGRPQGTLVFDVELLDIERMPDPPAAPDNLKEPGKGSKKTASGLVSRVLTKGKGTKRPKPESWVRVHYSGWTQSDGQMFDSSVVRGEPAMFPLNGVIPGWTEGVQLMVEGEKRRFWIPGKLAYDGGRGPQGTLVFDVELLEISDGPQGRIPGH